MSIPKIVAALVIAASLSAQTAVNYTFEVASIRPSDPAIAGSSTSSDQLWIRARGITVRTLIQMAYGIQPDQLFGIPNWVRDDRFDINAKYDQPEDENIPPGDQGRQAERLARHQMRLRNLLAERFQLKLREETKELQVYSLKVDSSGHKMKLLPDGKGGMNVNISNTTGSLRGEGITIANFSNSLSRILGKPVNNDTGLEGLYMVELKWSDSTAPDETLPSIFTAMKEQLGLRLDSTKGPVKTYVFEKAEKPSDN
jgi:uncharacterized protein (TIGR03435 family)